jgi:hypothetical protein
VAIVHRGTIHDVGPVSKLLDANVLQTDVILRVPPDARATFEARVPAGATARWLEEEVTVVLPQGADLQGFLKGALEVATVVSVAPRRESLEELFLKRTQGGQAS